MKYFLGSFVGIFIIFLLGSSIYKQLEKQSNSAKSTRIICQKNNTVFERVYNDKEIKVIQNKLKENNFTLSSSIKKAKYSKSKLFDFISLAQMDQITIETLNKYVIKQKLDDDKLRISYYIYENDIDDPGKKTAKSKLYAGYVVFKFKNNNNELIYQVQVDFMDKKGVDLPQSIYCAIKSFTTI